MTGVRTPTPPALARWLVVVTAQRSHRAAQVGDLEEEFAERAAVDAGAARRWYWRQAVGSVAPNLAFRARRTAKTTRGDGTMTTLLQNLRFALRGARQHLGFSAVVVGTLALGIGANTTIFSAVYGLILNPFPFPEPDRIVGVGTAYPKLGEELGFWENLSPLEWLDIQENSKTLEDVVAWTWATARSPARDLLRTCSAVSGGATPCARWT